MTPNPYLAATIEAALITTLPRRWWMASGRDAPRFLNNVLTANVRDLAVGAGAYTAICTAKGKMLGDLFIYRLGEEQFGLDVEAAQVETVIPAIKKYIVVDKVTLAANADGEMLAVVGPQAADQLRQRGIELPVTRKTWWGLDWIELWGTAAERVQWLKKLAELPLLDHTTQEVLRIESATPKYGVDMDENTIPQEAALYHALSFNKGCYIGQETIARLEHRGHVNRQLTLFRHTSADLPKAGELITTTDGKDAGAITSACISARHHAPIALGYIKYTVRQSGQPLAGYTVISTP